LLYLLLLDIKNHGFPNYVLYEYFRLSRGRQLEPKFQYFLATLTDFDESPTFFPYGRFEISKDLILFRDPENAYQIKACIVKDYVTSNYPDYQRIEQEYETFTSLYSLISNTQINHEFYEMSVIVDSLEKVGYTLSTPITTKIKTGSDEIFHDYKIMANLVNTKRIWNYYVNLPDADLKNRIETALKYYQYAKKADREEFRIINYCIAFETLFIIKETGKKNTISKRASKLLFPILWHNPELIEPKLKTLYETRNSIVHQGDYLDKIHKVELHWIDLYLKTALELFLYLAGKFNTKIELIQEIDRVEGIKMDHIVTRDEYYTFFEDRSNLLELAKELGIEQRKFFDELNKS